MLFSPLTSTFRLGRLFFPYSPLTRRNYASISRLVNVPIQNVLVLGSDDRMKIPVTTRGG